MLSLLPSPLLSPLPAVLLIRLRSLSWKPLSYDGDVLRAAGTLSMPAASIIHICCTSKPPDFEISPAKKLCLCASAAKLISSMVRFTRLRMSQVSVCMLMCLTVVLAATSRHVDIQLIIVWWSADGSRLRTPKLLPCFPAWGMTLGSDGHKRTTRGRLKCRAMGTKTTQRDLGIPRSAGSERAASAHMVKLRQMSPLRKATYPKRECRNPRTKVDPLHNDRDTCTRRGALP